MKHSTPTPSQPLLIVDDESLALASMEMALYAHGLDNVLTCGDSTRVMELMRERKIELVLLDLAMPGLSGEELLPEIVTAFPEVPVIVVTGFDDVTKAVACMRAGAYDYLVKPVEADQLATVVNRALERRELARENLRLREQLLTAEPQHPEHFAEIITASASMVAIFNYIEAIATTGQPILITGETGVGKELIARAIHRASHRKGQMVAINIAGLDETLFSDTLFGHVSGAFTGAARQRTGLIETAAGGTLFLDEIGDLAPISQVKLLRLLQEREYHPLGSDRPRKSNARIITATTRAVTELQAEQNFRNDLYYRLQTHHIHIPPLRQRKEDIAPLTEHFLIDAAKELQKRPPTAPKELVPLLMSYDFPGNVRELQALIFNAVARHQSRVLSLSSFHEYIDSQRKQQAAAGGNQPADLQFPRTLPTIREATRLLIAEALTRAGGNQSLAARMLGISSQALSQRLKREHSP